MNKKKEAKMLADLRRFAKIRTESLKKEMEINQKCTDILSELQKEKMSKYAKTTMHYQLLSQQRSLTRQMEFKDMLIDKLQNEIYEYIGYRDKNNAELVNDTLSAFKQNIGDIHDQYEFQINESSPKNLHEIEMIVNENDKYWKILKYNSSVLHIQTKNRNSIIENEHIVNMTHEKNRLLMTSEKFRANDNVHNKIMKDKYHYILNNYKKFTENLMKNYLTFKEKDDYMTIVENKLSARIKELLNTMRYLEKKIEEPTSMKEVNMLIKERDKLQKWSDQFNNKNKNHSEYGQKQLFLLCKTTKRAYSEMSNVLKKGDGLMKNIRLCQKLETSEDKTFLYPMCNEPVVWPAEEQMAVLEKLSYIFQRLSYIKLYTKSLDGEIDKIQLENKNLKEKIYYLQRNKNK